MSDAPVRPIRRSRESLTFLRATLPGTFDRIANAASLPDNREMLHRPWSIVLFTWGHILAPFISWTYTLIYLRIPIAHADVVFSGMKWFHIVRWFALMPLAGLAIYQMKPWSLPIFSGALALQLWTNYQAWLGHPRAFSIALFLAYFVVDGIVVAYFLRPSVRRLFFEKSLRWWESRPRYHVALPLEIESAETVGLPPTRVRTADFSVGGLFVPAQPSLIESPFLRPEANRDVTLRLRFGRMSRTLHGRIVHQGHGGTAGLGVSFRETGRRDHFWLLAVAATLAIRRTPKRVIARRNLSDFQNWISSLFDRSATKSSIASPRR